MMTFVKLSPLERIFKFCSKDFRQKEQFPLEKFYFCGKFSNKHLKYQGNLPMPRLTPENKELHTSQMRQNICRTFAEMFAAQGDVSMEHLAEKMGIAKGTIYNYFEDKKALTAAVMEMRRKAMTALMEEKISPELPASEQLELFVSIMWQDFNTYRHLRLEYLRNNPVLHLPHRPRPLDILKRIIEQGIASGEFRKTDPEEAALFIFCSLVGKFRHFLLKDLEADTEKEKNVMLSFLFPALKNS